MSTRAAWRLFGALGIAQIVISFSAFAFNSPMVELGSSQDRLRKALVDTAQWRGLASNYTEVLAAMVAIAAGTLLARLLLRSDVVGAWLAFAMATAIVVSSGLTMVSAAAGGVTHYDAHHGVGLDVLTSIDHLRDFAFFGSVATMGMFAAFAGAAIVRTRALSPVLGWLGVVVGIASIGSVAGAIGGLHNIGSLVATAWLLAISIAAFRVSATEEA